MGHDGSDRYNVKYCGNQTTYKMLDLHTTPCYSSLASHQWTLVMNTPELCRSLQQKIRSHSLSEPAQTTS